MIFSVYLQVGDLSRSLSFYRDGLGLEVAWNDDMLAVLDHKPCFRHGSLPPGSARTASSEVQLHQDPANRPLPHRRLAGHLP